MHLLAHFALAQLIVRVGLCADRWCMNCEASSHDTRHAGRTEIPVSTQASEKKSKQLTLTCSSQLTPSMKPLIRSFVLAYIILDFTELPEGALQAGIGESKMIDYYCLICFAEKETWIARCKSHCRDKRSTLTSARRRACSGSCSCPRYCKQNRRLWSKKRVLVSQRSSRYEL